jgi:hypothetical protein
MEKMPLDYFGFYSLLVPFVDGYYRVNEIEKANTLTSQIAQKYAERLSYFNSLEADLQYGLGEEIITEIERYRTLIEANLKHGEHANLLPLLDQFMIASSPFKYLYGDYEFYTSLTDAVEGYYLVNEIDKAQSLAKKISSEFSGRLALFGQFPPQDQLSLMERIKDEFVEFSYLVQIIKAYDSTEFSTNAEEAYNASKDSFLKVLDPEQAALELVD